MRLHKVKTIPMLFCLLLLGADSYALSPESVFNMVKDSVVVVRTLDSSGRLIIQGSGVVLPSKKIATNSHVVEGGSFFQVSTGERIVKARLYAKDGEKDVCLLDVDELVGKVVQIGKTMDLRVGSTVYAVGAPQGFELSLSDGIVSQLRGGPPPLIQSSLKNALTL